jgi:hypothetical protein
LNIGFGNYANIWSNLKNTKGLRETSILTFCLKSGGNLNAWFKTKVSVTPVYTMNKHDVYYLHE